MTDQFAYTEWVWGLDKREHLIAGCKDLSEVGFHNIELVESMSRDFLNNRADFDAIMQEYDMHTAGFYFMLNPDLKQDVKNMCARIDFFAHTGAKNLNLQGVWDGTPANEEDLRAHLDTVNAFAEAAEANGMTVTIHPHHHTKLMYESDIDFIMQNTDPAIVGLSPDTAHLLASKLDPIRIIEKYKNRVYFTHLKDMNQSAYYLSDAYDVTKMEYSEFREMGEGDLDLEKILSILKSVNYAGYLCAETDGTRTTHKNSAAISLAYMKKHW